MNLADGKLNQLDNPALTPEKRALLRCRLAAEFIHTGRYEAAREALGEFWQGVGVRPDLRGLSILTTAEVLLQCGTLSGWLGSVRNVPDAQEKAKDLLTEAQRKFQSQGQYAKVSEAQYELGMCYWRTGAFDESRVVLKEAAERLTQADIELKAKILIRRTLVEVWTGRYYEALRVLKEARSDFDSANDALKGRWHGQMGLLLVRLAAIERNAEYIDRAIIEFTAAIVHYEQARHERYCGTNLNNLAMLFQKLGRYEDAHAHLDRAERIFVSLNDAGNLAQVNETRARVLICEHRYEEADRLIGDVVQVFEKGGEYALLADALVVQGVAWARLGRYESSVRILRSAINVASNAGSPLNAGQAALVLIEEHGESRLSETEVYNLYRRADEWLKDTQDAEDIDKLRACARLVMKRLLGVKLSDADFSLTKAVLEYEAKFIEEALDAEQGSISRAARRLGIKHQTLAHILRTRHKKLLEKRTPPVSRPRSLIKKRD